MHSAPRHQTTPLTASRHPPAHHPFWSPVQIGFAALLVIEAVNGSALF